ncbi:MAG: metal-sensitive transcriptional regulator [Chloroflexi bacterium]|nr:metal-sensitive transcriptional regulator [Chloroflexota bacterium]
MPTRNAHPKTMPAVCSTDRYLTAELVQDLKNRLSRLEGHLRGIQRMLDEQAACEDLLIQTSAVRAALNQITIKMLEGHMETCVMESVEEGRGAAALDQLKGALAQVLKNA